MLFPHSDLRTAKTRPALVVQADNLQTGLPQVIVAMITSRMLRAQHQEIGGHDVIVSPYFPAFDTRRTAVGLAHEFSHHDR